MNNTLKHAIFYSKQNNQPYKFTTPELASPSMEFPCIERKIFMNGMGINDIDGEAILNFQCIIEWENLSLFL